MEEQFLLLLHQLQRRLRWVDAMQRGLRWGWWGGWISVVAALCLKVTDATRNDLWNSLWVAVVIGMCGFVLSWSRPPSLKRVARLTDQTHHLQERVVSVLEDQQSWRPKTSVSQFLLQDGLRALKEVDPVSTFPNPWRWAALRFVLPILLVGGIIVSPSWSGWLHRIPEADRQAVRRSSQRVEDLARRLREQQPNSAEAKRLAARLDELAKKLAKPKTDRASAAAELEKAVRELRRESVQARSPLAPSRQARAARSAAAAELQKLAQEARSGNTADASEAIKKALSRATPGSEQEKALREAAKMLAQGDPKKAAEALEKAAKQTQQGGNKGQGESDEPSAQDSQLAQQTENALAEEGESLEPGSCKTNSPKSQGTAGGPADGQDGPGVAVNPDGPKGGAEGQPGTTHQGDFGKGTTNEHQKAEGANKGPRLVRQADRKPTWEESYKKLYGAERKHFQTADTKVKGQRDKGRLLPTQGIGWGAPQAGGQALLQGEESFLNSKADAEQAIAQGQIPAADRDVVRNYFQQIDPRSQR